MKRVSGVSVPTIAVYALAALAIAKWIVPAQASEPPVVQGTWGVPAARSSQSSPTVFPTEPLNANGEAQSNAPSTGQGSEVLFEAPSARPQPETSTPAAVEFAQASRFPDVAGHWAQPFIETLATRGLVAGFPDGSFRPNATVTRAEFAAMIRQAFDQPTRRTAVEFEDVPASYWAYTAIQTAYRTGFLSGFPDGTFRPEEVTPRVQALVSLASGLELSSNEAIATLLNRYYQDAAQIPNYAQGQIAAATSNRVVVNYPNPELLRPDQAATRADVAAFIYQALVNLGELPQIPPSAPVAQYIVGPSDVATTPPPPTSPSQPLPEIDIPSAAEIEEVQAQLGEIRATDFGNIYRGSPAVVISNPMGFGADRNTVFLGATFQEDVRGSEEADGAAVIGVGLGDAQRVVGAELSYTFASFGNNRDFGTGGFNIKLHRQIGRDTSVAVGWDGFIITGDSRFDVDFEDSVYGVATHIVRLRPSLDSAFSRVALTAGLGTGRFQTIDDLRSGADDINPFGSVAVRVAQPISFITEWTGQDLALGFSIVPIRDFNWVITPAVRDIAGDDIDEARFVLGTGFSFQF
jgi:hypothetical protein